MESLALEGSVRSENCEEVGFRVIGLRGLDAIIVVQR